VSYSRFARAGLPAAVKNAESRARALFRRHIGALYDPADRERGFVAARRPDGSTIEVPLLELRAEATTLEALGGEPTKSARVA
jgi:hypothetical protein